MHCVYGHSGVDRGGKLLFYFARCVYVDVDREVNRFFFLFVRCVYCAIYAFHIYPVIKSERASRLDNMDPKKA